ncbi:hypothetical protein TNCV_2880101 [Trichonephila clavipes]|uniref:Uncharacterized protein n=1 Tax=Trichonephila clavipes TaxID=2585209 RepID=A0A8X6W261_TRICX|nr:hypothetical protein TNCV_2880101 [Trichonephila clavipes]
MVVAATLRRGQDHKFMGGCGSLVYKVTIFWQACHELEPNTAEDPTYRGDRCTLNRSRLKSPSVGEFRILRPVAKNSRAPLSCDAKRTLILIHSWSDVMSSSPRVTEEDRVGGAGER